MRQSIHRKDNSIICHLQKTETAENEGKEVATLIAFFPFLLHKLCIFDLNIRNEQKCPIHVTTVSALVA